MESLMNVSPGLMLWTLINFFIFFGIIVAFGLKPIMNGVKSREDSIAKAIETSEKSVADAQKLFKESQDKIAVAQAEMTNIIKQGKEQADAQIKKALEEANKVKAQKIEEAKREIDRSKEAALVELRKEVSSLVISATEKLLDANLDHEKQIGLINNFLNEKAKIN